MPTTTVQAADPLTDLLIHDIRTPLAAISGYAQLLLRRAAQGEPELPAVVDGLQRIEDAARRVGNLLGELADLQAQSGACAGRLDRRFHGSGLALASVHQVVTEHGGTIVVESQIGIGTTATVRLPLEVSPR
jgi:cell cycle sensor histidine kinase DivJ